MKTNYLKQSALLLLIPIAFWGCKKYEEGGQKRKARENLTQNWVLDTYLRNGNDEKNTLRINDLQEQYADNGVYSRSYTDSNGDFVVENGTWEFDNDQEEIDVSGVSSIADFSENFSTISSSTYHIKKLTKNDLWYFFANGGDVHEFHFVSQ